MCETINDFEQIKLVKDMLIELKQIRIQMTINAFIDKGGAFIINYQVIKIQ